MLFYCITFYVICEWPIVLFFGAKTDLKSSLFQIFCRGQNANNSTRMSGNSSTSIIGRQLIVSLAIADLCASLGVFTRSALWKYVKNFVPMENDSPSVLFCAASSAWTQFFYTATWFYTLVYAISVYLILKGRMPPLKRYHSFVWTMSAALTVTGVTILYVPDAMCHDIHDVSTALLRVLPIYLATYIPILTVMIVNPILYYLSSKQFDEQLAVGHSQVTSSERVLMKRFKVKFAVVNGIFILCWLPNLLSGVLLWFFWYNTPAEVLLVAWNLMACLNPLQAFFNTLVYRKWTRITLPEKVRGFFKRKPKIESTRLLERSPLLRHESGINYNSGGYVSSIESIGTQRSVNSCSCV